MTTEVTAIFNLLNESIDNNRDCLTIYRTMDNWSETIIKIELQNQLKALLKDCPSTLEGRQINAVAEDIITQVLTLPFYKKSVGIFVSLDLSNAEKIEVILNKNLIVIFSDEEIEDLQICGKIFSLLNLFKMTKLFSDTLNVYISKKDTRFYLNNNEFTLIGQMDNVILEKYEDRFRNQTPGGVQGSATHGGSGADEKEDKFNKTTLNDVLKKLKEIAQTQNRYKSIIVFVSSEFSGYEDFILPELRYFSETEPVIIKKTIDKESNFEIEFKKADEENHHNLNKAKIEKYMTSIDGLFEKDIELIVECARESRIHKLYINEDYKIEGYILTRDIPYFQKTDGANKTDQLQDWVIRKVIETGGEVFVLGKDNKELESGIAARLRY